MKMNDESIPHCVNKHFQLLSNHYTTLRTEQTKPKTCRQRVNIRILTRSMSFTNNVECLQPLS